MNRNKIYPRYFALGALIIYFVFFFLPGLIGVGYSFTDWSAYSDELHYVGFQNFKTVFSADENYMKIITNTLEFTKWLVTSELAFGSVMAVDIWRGVGYIMTILIAGILSISSDYYEAAAIDGAGGWKKFRYITLPLILPTLATTTVLNVIYGLKVFDMVYALTNGGPGKATTEVLYTAVFKKFGTGQYAVGTALSSVMFVIMIFVGAYMIRVMTKNEVVE